MTGTIVDEFDTVWAPENKAIDETGAQFSSVQEAVDSADSLVMVGAGTFNESVTISTQSLVLTGTGRSTVIDGGTAGHAVELNASDVVVQDVAAKTEAGAGNQNDGFFVVDQENHRCTIRGCFVIDSDRFGFALRGDRQHAVIGCVTESSDAYAFWGRDVADSVFTACRAQGDVSGSAFRLHNQARRVVITGNTARNPTFEGVNLDGATACTVVGNSLHSTGDEGIHIKGADTLVANNHVNAPSSHGISVAAADCIVTGNRVVGAGDDGINVSGADDIVRNNHVTGSTNQDYDTANATRPWIDHVASGTATLASNTATISTGVTSTGAKFDVYLDPAGGGNNAADVKASARTFWDNSAGEYKVEIIEDGTNVGNPDVGYHVERVA